MKSTDGKLPEGVEDGLSLPRPSTSDLVVRHIERTCRTVIDGRRAARALADWAQQFSLTEAEFQLLWRLRTAASDGLDQTRLSGALVTSPAKTSTTVERLRAAGWIRQQALRRDRRRQCWQLTAGGQKLLDEMLHAAALLRYAPGPDPASQGDRGPSQEEAA